MNGSVKGTTQIKYSVAVLSISFEVDVPTEKVVGSLLFECRRRELPRGIWPPPENFEIQTIGNAIFNVLQTVLGP